LPIGKTLVPYLDELVKLFQLVLCDEGLVQPYIGHQRAVLPHDTCHELYSIAILCKVKNLLGFLAYLARVSVFKHLLLVGFRVEGLMPCRSKVRSILLT